MLCYSSFFSTLTLSSGALSHEGSYECAHSNDAALKKTIEVDIFC